MSKKLYLIRHADTGRTITTDFERLLTDEGVAEAEHLGRQIKSAHIRFDSIVSSTAARAAATARIIAKAQGIDEDQILWTKDLYHATPEQIDMVLRQLPEDVGDTLALVGHNTGISDYANKKIQYRQAASMHTATIVGMQLPIDRWDENHPAIIATSL